MPSLLRKVKTRLWIHAHRKVRGLLEGEYTSVFHGRSIEFDDVRHYVAGDELKDIDWKATARMGTPMTRRYIATRKHVVLLVTDTGRDMAALSADGDPKIDIAILAAGVMGYLAARHGDLVGLVAGDADRIEVRAPASTEAHLERILQLMHSRTTLRSARSDLTRQLAFIARSFRRRMILFVIADDRVLGDAEVALLGRLAAQHEIVWFTVADADPTRADWSAADMYDVADDAALPSYLRGNRRLREQFAAETASRTERAQNTLDRLAISSRRVESEADVIPGLFRLLEVHRHARR